MPHETTLTHLAGLYAASDDPWGHLSRPYEREKYARTLDAIGQGPFCEAVEVGCGIGALSELLAPRCARLTAIEAVPQAAARARARLGRLPQVRVIDGAAPAALPDVAPDLVVLSEVLYFMIPDEVDRLAGWIGRAAAPEVRVVAVNWTGPTGEVLDGRAAADRLRTALVGFAGPRHEAPGHLIDVLSR